MTTWLHAYMATCLHGYMATWLHGYMAYRTEETCMTIQS
jgi:hypothetical protein